MHTRAIAAIRPLEQVSVYSPNPDRRQAFADRMANDLGVAVDATDTPEAACVGAQIVVAAARSDGEVPILYGDWLDPDATVISIGSTIPAQREIDVSVVERCDLIVCDVVDEVLHGTGDMTAAANAGVEVIDKSLSLSVLLSGAVDGRVADARTPLFKSVGSGLQDIVVAELLLTGALAAGLATPLPIAFETKS